jgi:hypothetical protein
MKIAAILFFEINSEDLAIELVARMRRTDDRTKARNEQNLEVSD